MPGIPAIYYGSEWGIEGQKLANSDAPLRPTLDLATVAQSAPHPELVQTIAKLSRIRLNSPALQVGDYQQLYVAPQQLAFARKTADDFVLVAVNASERSVSIKLAVPNTPNGQLYDLLNPGETLPVSKGVVHIDPVWPNWARILKK